MARMSEKKYPIDPKDYKLHEEIGEGVSATVYRASCIPFNEIVAVKVLDLEKCDNDLDGIQREVQMMSLIYHPNVLHAHCSFISGTDLWVVMPYFSGGSCLHIMRFSCPHGFEEPVIATLLHEVLKALVYLHLQGRIHRDVKAGNILIGASGAVKLADFGVAACMFDSGVRQRARNSFVGTPCWMAPEVMEQTRSYDYKADIWSFGITALELAHGHAPLSKYPPMKVLLLTLQNAPPGFNYERDKRFSKSFKEMIAACLVKDPQKRPSAEKLLKHSFFKNARSSEYLARAVLSGLPPLGERFRQLKAKDIELLLQDKASNGDEKHLTQQEYMHGISNWKFDLDDLKAQAALIEESDGFSMTEDPDKDLSESAKDEITDIAYVENVNFSNSEIIREDKSFGTGHLEESLAFSFPMLPLRALKGCFDVCEDEISPDTPDLKDAAQSHFSQAENVGSETREDVTLERSCLVTPNVHASDLSKNTSPSRDVTGDTERDDQEHRLQSGRNSSTPISYRQLRDSCPQIAITRAKSEERVVQQKGRFRVTAPDTPPKGDKSAKVQNNLVTGTRTSSSVDTPLVLSSLWHLLQQTSMQKEQLFKLIKHIEQSPGQKISLGEATKRVRERELQSYAAHLQQCYADLSQELQKLKTQNVQLERQLVFSLARKKSGRGNEPSY